MNFNLKFTLLKTRTKKSKIVGFLKINLWFKKKSSTTDFYKHKPNLLPATEQKTNKKALAKNAKAFKHNMSLTI